MNKQVKITRLYETVRTLGFELGYAPDTFGASDATLGSSALNDTAHAEFAAVLNTALATVSSLSPIKARRTLAITSPIFYQKSLAVGTVCRISGACAISFNTLGGAVAVFTLADRSVRKAFAAGTSSYRATLEELFGTDISDGDELVITLEQGTLINLAAFNAPYQSPYEIPTLGLTATFDVSDLASELSSTRATLYNGDEVSTVDLSSGYVTLPGICGTVATLEYCKAHSTVTVGDVQSPTATVEISPDAEHLLVYLCASLYLADREPDLAARYHELYTTYAATLRASKRGGIYVQRWLADGRIV